LPAITTKLKLLRELTVHENRMKSMQIELSVHAQDHKKIDALKYRLKQLEQQLRREQSEHQMASAAKDAEIDRLTNLVEDQLNKYRDLKDVNIKLDTEIATYGKLLELEESRLNAACSEASETSTSSASYHSIHDSTSTSYVTVSTVDVGIEIRDVDAIVESSFACTAKRMRAYHCQTGY